MGAKDEFEEETRSFLPIWKQLGVVTELSLAARILNDDEKKKFGAACECYQKLASDASGDKEKPLKRHMYAHMKRLADEEGTVGLFSETAFESIHAVINAIERRYLAQVETIRDVNIRKAYILKQDREARAARNDFLDERAVGPRAAK